MAYKFQVGPAVLSGSTKFEELVEAAGGFKPTVDDTAAAVADDSFYFQDADGSMKRESMVDYAAAIAGDGLSADAGVLEVEVSELAAVTAIASGDTFAIAQEAETGDPTRKITFDNMAVKLAGDGLASSSGVLSVGVDDSGIELSSDALRLKDNGVTLAKMAGITRGSIISGDASGDPQALAVGSAHQFLQSDGTDLAYVSMSGDATLAAGVLSIGATKVTDAMINDDVATGLAGVGLSAASGVLALDASEISDAAVASGDKFVFEDATDNSTKKESVDDIATLFAGAGLGASSAVLSVQVSGAIKVASDKLGISGSFAGDGIKFLGGADSISSIEIDLNELPATAGVADGDFFAFVDATDNTTKKDAVADLATLFAGNGLVAASSVLAVNVDDSGIELNSDAIRLKDNGVTLAKMAGIARGSIISGDASGDPQALAVGSAHQFLQSDGSDLAYVSMSGDATLAAGVLSIGATKVTDAMMNDDVATGLAGDGLAAVSGSLSVGVDGSTIETSGDALRLKDDGVTGAKLAPAVAGEGLKQDGSGNLELDINGLNAGVVAVGADSIAIVDADDNVSKKESIADLVGAMAGSGLVAASGVLSTRMDVTTAADADYNAAFGLNISTANYTAPRTVTLPTANAADAGRMLIVKGRNAGSHTLSIARNGSDVIDGSLTSLSIESDNGAVTLLCASAGNWIIV